MKLAAVRSGIPPGHRLSYLGAFATRGDELFAVGGAYSTPTLLRSLDRGATFEAWPTPKTPGLRDMVFVDDAVWVVGEEGMVAHTRDGGTWTQVPVDTTRCVYTIARDLEGRIWMGGEGGYLVRQAGDAFKRIPRRSKENVFDIFFDDDGTPWVMGINMLQRWAGKKLVTVQLSGRPTIARIARTAAGTLVAIGRAGEAWRSTDRGATWDKVDVGVEGGHNLEAIATTPYGIFVVGPGLLVSLDDGMTFARVQADLDKHLWAVGFVPGALLVGGTETIQRIPSSELARLLRADRDPVIAEVAGRVEDGDDGAELVLEDALRERGRY